MKKIVLALAAAFVVVAQSASAGETAKGTNFSVVVPDSNACKADQVCTVKITVNSLNNFHVNKEYPTKLKVDEVAGIEFQGTDPAGKNVFSKAKNDFVLGPDVEKAGGPIVGTMTVTFKAKANAKITGKLKFSVCSAQNCQMETADVTAAVTVSK